MTEGIKGDESNFACPSFLSLQTYRLAGKHRVGARMLFSLIVSFISEALAAFIERLTERLMNNGLCEGSLVAADLLLMKCFKPVILYGL